MSSTNNLQQVEKVRRSLYSWRVERRIGIVAVAIFLAAGMAPSWLVILMSIPAFTFLIWKREVFITVAHKMLFTSKMEREIQAAARDSGFGDIDVESVVETLPGERAEVIIPRGSTYSSLVRSSESMATCLKASELHIIPGENKSLARLEIIRRDPLLAMDKVPWPLIDAEHVNIRKGVPFGLDRYGNVFDARLLNCNIILGGAPGAGKSAALRMLIAAGALDPSVKLWMLDGKQEGAEFVHWSACAHRLIRGRQLEAAVEMFAELEDRVAERSRRIVAAGEVMVPDDMELDLLIVDELPQFMRIFETDTKAEQAAVKTIREAIWKLIALGRWAGMITILAAQKPTGDIIPTESRDLIDHKFALHCNTAPMLKAILGDNAAEETISVNDIPSKQPGLGYYVGDEGPVKIRNFFIDHTQALDIASRVSSRQLDDELSTLTA